AGQQKRFHDRNYWPALLRLRPSGFVRREQAFRRCHSEAGLRLPLRNSAVASKGNPTPEIRRLGSNPVFDAIVMGSRRQPMPATLRVLPTAPLFRQNGPPTAPHRKKR